MENKDTANIREALAYIQQNIRVRKSRYNKFGKYNYRSCEDILEGVKPCLQATHTSLVLNDEVVLVGDRFYVMATATLANMKGEAISSTGYAREELAQSGMSAAQLTGSTSSYARKYALNALFAIDDNQDPDETNTHKTDRKSILAQAMNELQSAETIEQVKDVYKRYTVAEPSLAAKTSEFFNAVSEKCRRLKGEE